MREGAHHIAAVQQVEGYPTEPVWIFIMPGHQEMLDKHMGKLYSLIGYSGTATGSFDSTWRNIQSRTN